jgi:hypothetical protein
MRLIKRFLLFLAEVAVIVSGLFFSLTVAHYFDSGENNFAVIALLSGVFLTVVSISVFRRKTRQWKIRYDAVNWQLVRVERKIHPVRARYKRAFQRILLCVPSATAALALFFFPVASHLLHPDSRYLRHYRIPIPWTFTVFPSRLAEEYTFVNTLVPGGGNGRLGLTPFWSSRTHLSLMSFESLSSDAPSFAFNYDQRKSRRENATQVSYKVFQFKNVDFSCWQYIPSDRRGFSFWVTSWDLSAPVWEITCETPVDEHRRNLSASFHGRQQDLSAFYNVVQGVSPID